MINTTERAIKIVTTLRWVFGVASVGLLILLFLK